MNTNPHRVSQKERSGVFCVIGNCVSYDTKTLREDATGAQMNMQADACAHQRAKSRKATLCSVIGVE